MKVSYILFILVILQIGVITVSTEYIRTNANAFTKVCNKIVSYQATRNTPYLETYKERTWGLFYKTKVRWNYKIEYFTSWRREYTCCDGYLERSSNASLDCEPICKPPCGNGTCIKPNVCICNSGYAEETDIVFDSICIPVCTRTCVHGRCTAPENCTCDNGYSLSNDGYTCEPVCNEPCGKGAYCSKPGVCTCLPGYSNRSTSHCSPICNYGCIHGKCTAPGVCTCDDGFEPVTLVLCKPKCEHGCINGMCKAPNVCICEEGYSLKYPGICEPVCSQPCVMGTCEAPEICSCFEGYEMLENSKYICEPFCEKACLNGKCTSPSVCTCNKGFQKSRTKHICEPYCETSCEPFGVCTAPNVCTCFDGYQLVDANQTTEIRVQYAAATSVCEPICHTPCVNGFCSGPDACLCNDGYYRSDSNVCTPRCLDECSVNSFCSAPNTCTCNTGYRLPKTTSDICEPFCEENCVNGYCSAPNECNCNAGYSLSASSMNVCGPVCHPACKVHGICLAPDLCTCQNGYRMVHYNDVNVPFGCEPICNVECGNGTCTAPEACTCFDGYQNAETGKCVPVCRMCGNGTCVAPGVCVCDSGFFLMDPVNTEVPDSHIALDEDRSGNGSRCMPRCESCDNGECVAPDECRCDAGYVKIEGTCVHACHNGCGTHGECVQERRSCECHYGWTGSHCDQPTLCILSVNGEGNHTESLNIIEEQNATIEYVLLNNPACPECIDEMSNETLCFNISDTKYNESRIGCLMGRVTIRNVPQYIPYTETYRSRAMGFYRPQIRTNYKIEYHVLWSVEPKCCDGFVQVGRMCTPHCLHPCERGICIQPNVCKCNTGYRMSYNVTSGTVIEMCVPVCTNGCVNGTCVDAEVCSCNDGYWMDADGFTCRPVCDIECERNHGYCAEPDVCSCRPGYVRAERDESTTYSPHGIPRCEPVCDRACTNGRCTAPNICSCAVGYEADEADPRFTCSPRCDEGCAFGKCTAPGICNCDDGYRPVNASVCEPICRVPCVMGTCVAPETCNCELGYGLLGDSKYVCKPICETSCGNGTCTAPGVCSCNNGYSAVNASTCEPICSEPCVMGVCVAPESCNCNVGYAHLGDSKYICEPICKTGCANGTCTAPNRCTCDDGFALRNASFCEPVCERNCQNGDCVGPNQCVCHDNFVPSTRHNFSTECVPACTRNCSGHGVCMVNDENDGCQCYFGWTGWDCDRPTVCVVTVDLIRTDISKLTIYNVTNSTIMRAHENAPHCYQCDDDFLDTESLCYVVQSDEANTTVSCLLSTDLPCYMAPRYDSSIDFAKIAWPLVAVAILILTSIIAASYLIYRRHQRKKLITARSSTRYAREAFATESLLSENVIYL
ncbi:fibrillin-2 [Ooceraea biroi]|uniref:fibrillin-2 n=1 Tax=Ooceraea biroi TaxID=2015173 RepID=UPI000F085C38|nr:fibrillin-2 [Ooceraea biroi]